MTAPIGSIVAYAGSVDDTWETSNGWLLCDGRVLDRADPQFTLLFDAIGFFWGGDLRDRFNLPDLRGYFLRGVDAPRGNRDPDSDVRVENHENGHQGRAVGSVQGWATALPERDHAIKVAPAGRHHHTMSFELNATRDVDGQDNTVAYPGPTHTTDTVGHHVHELEGGHRETRPINAYVNWIIRFR
jgi:microcystin-dependent protein